MPICTWTHEQVLPQGLSKHWKQFKRIMENRIVLENSNSVFIQDERQFSSLRKEKIHGSSIHKLFNFSDNLRLFAYYKSI